MEDFVRKYGATRGAYTRSREVYNRMCSMGIYCWYVHETPLTYVPPGELMEIIPFPVVEERLVVTPVKVADSDSGLGQLQDYQPHDVRRGMAGGGREEEKAFRAPEPARSPSDKQGPNAGKQPAGDEDPDPADEQCAPADDGEGTVPYQTVLITR
jgi:hypothetical protein